MKHLRAFLTAWLSICLCVFVCACDGVSVSITPWRFCVKCAVTVAGLTALCHSHRSLTDPLPSCSPICCLRSYSRSISRNSCFSWCSPPPVLYLSFPFLLCSSPSSPSSSSYLPQCLLIGGVRKGSAMTSSGPPTDPVPPFSKPSFLAISPVLVFWLGPRPPRHKGVIMGYNWLACVARLWDGPLPVPPCPPLLFVFGLLPKNWASNLASGQRGKPSVSVCLSLSLSSACH